MYVSGVGGGMDKGERTDNLDRVVKRRPPQECELLETQTSVPGNSFFVLGISTLYNGYLPKFWN